MHAAITKSTAPVNSIAISLLIFLYVYTGTEKLLAFQQNAIVLSQLPIIGRYGNFLAITLPVSELLLSFALLIPATTRIALFISLALLLTFTAYLIISLFNHYDLPCTCGGVIQQLTWKQHVLFNTAFIAINIVAIYRLRTHHKKSLQSGFIAEAPGSKT